MRQRRFRYGSEDLYLVRLSYILGAMRRRKETILAKINHNYLKLPGSYLFSEIGRRVREFSQANPEAKIIRLGIGDVTQPIAPAVIEALHGAVDEMGHAETFRGYAPDLGYEFLRDVIALEDYKARGCEISAEDRIGLPCVIPFIRYMWIPTSWLAGQVPMMHRPGGLRT